jgi:hypothetical protein
MPDYRAVETQHPTLFEGYYRAAGGAKLKTAPYKNSKLKFSDYDAGINYTYSINPEHTLSLGLGTYANTVNWDKNPCFIHKDYNYVVGSAGFSSLGVENWRWSGSSVLAFQTQNFGITKSGWISALFWGEYFVNKTTHIHVGFWGYTGVKNIYFLPILGFDWKLNHAELSAIFPFDIAARYKPNKNFHLELAGKWFGGPYRFPQRISQGINGYEQGIFEIFAPTTELGAYYHPSAHLNIGLMAGFTYGGWLQVTNQQGHNKSYYDFKSAPYGAVSGVFKF